MHAAQRILRVIVVELGDRSNGTPGVGGVAVLAREIQVPMRAARNPRCLLLCMSLDRGDREKDDPKQTSHARISRHAPPSL